MYSYTFRKGSVVVTEGVSGSVLAINPVVRGDEGTYTCEVTNNVGMATVTGNLFVVGESMFVRYIFAQSPQWGPVTHCLSLLLFPMSSVKTMGETVCVTVYL